jgi:hypothetical protein
VASLEAGSLEAYKRYERVLVGLGNPTARAPPAASAVEQETLRRVAALSLWSVRCEPRSIEACVAVHW